MPDEILWISFMTKGFYDAFCHNIFVKALLSVSSPALCHFRDAWPKNERKTFSTYSIYVCVGGRARVCVCDKSFLFDYLCIYAQSHFRLSYYIHISHLALVRTIKYTKIRRTNEYV